MAIEDKVKKARKWLGLTVLSGVITTGSTLWVINNYRPDLVSQKAADAAMIVVDYQVERHPELMKDYKDDFIDYGFEIPGKFDENTRKKMHEFTLDNLTKKQYRQEMLEVSKAAAQKYPGETIKAYSNDQLTDEYSRRIKEKGRDFWEGVQQSESYKTLRDAFLKLMY